MDVPGTSRGKRGLPIDNLRFSKIPKRLINVLIKKGFDIPL